MLRIRKLICLLVTAVILVTAGATQAFAAGSYKIPSDLKAELSDIYDYYDFTIGWGLYDLSGGGLKEVASYNANRVFQSNCTVKAAMLIYICKLMDEGKLSKSTRIKVNKNELCYGGLASGNYTVNRLLTGMIRVSNSACFEVFHRYVTKEKYNDYLASIGSGTRMHMYGFMGVCKVSDRATEWYEIYKYCHSDAEHADYAWRQFRTALYSPIRTGLRVKTVAHKGGWYAPKGVRGSAGDCAIVKTKNGGCYLMIIFTHNNKVGDFNTNLIGRLARTLDDVWNSYYKSLDSKKTAEFW